MYLPWLYISRYLCLCCISLCILARPFFFDNCSYGYQPFVVWQRLVFWFSWAKLYPLTLPFSHFRLILACGRLDILWMQCSHGNRYGTLKGGGRLWIEHANLINLNVNKGGRFLGTLRISRLVEKNFFQVINLFMFSISWFGWN